MDYGTQTCTGQQCDLNYLRFVGWSESNACVQYLFSKPVVNLISKKVTELTMGVDKKNRPFVVTDDRICEVISSVFWNYRPATGDIYSRYIIPTSEQENAVQSIIDQTIELITSYIKNQYGIVDANQQLSAWVQVMGDFNPHGLRQFPPIKTKDRRPETMQFNMNY
jgi:hypothetical protein